MNPHRSELASSAVSHGTTEGDDGTSGVKLLICDDVEDIRMLMRVAFETDDDFEVVGEADDGRGAIALARHHSPDLVLLDLAMPGGSGIDAIKRIRAGGDGPAVLVLTSFAGEDQVVPAVRAGASGYLLKDVAVADLEAAIRTLHAGGSLLDSQVVGAVMGEVARGPSRSGVDLLTPREREVLSLLGAGLSNRQVAERLFVAEKTVKTHVSAVLSKLGLADRTQAAVFAVRHGMAADQPET